MKNQPPRTRTDRPSQSWARRAAPKVAVVLMAIAAVTAIGLMPAKKREVVVAQAPPVNVSVLTVAAEAELPDTFDLPAVVEPNRIVTVAAEVAGRVEQIPPREGSTVQAGDLLVQLNTDLIGPQVEIAEAQHSRDKIQYDRMAALIKTDAAARSDVDDATTRLATSKAQLQEVRARLERSRILAPITGVLNDLPIEDGEYVQPGTPVAELVETDPAKVVVEVPERDVPFFCVGQKAEVLVDGSRQTMAGTITFISELADAQTRSTRMEITLDNRDRLLRSGQIVKARLTRRVLTDAILIPLLAVIPMEEGKVVYVVASGRAERRQVKLDVIKGNRVQITEGLAPGDQLIVAGHRFVAPGQKVNVVATTAASGQSTQ